MMLMMMPYYELMSVLVLRIGAGVSETSAAWKRSGGGEIGSRDSLVSLSHAALFMCQTSRSILHSLSLSFVNHLSVCSHIHPSVLGGWRWSVFLPT